MKYGKAKRTAYIAKSTASRGETEFFFWSAPRSSFNSNALRSPSTFAFVRNHELVHTPF
jgi:hypothetical protein